MGPFVTISGATVDAALVIDALVAKIGELALENAALRAQVTVWSALAHSQAEEGRSSPSDASESPTGASPRPVETPPGWVDPENPSEMPRSGGYVPVSGS